MALVVATLQNELLSLFDKDFVLFKGFPNDYIGAANNFSNAINTYASVVTPPSTTSVVAGSAFVSTFIGNKSLESVDILYLSIVAYASALGLGMAPAFVATPPSGGGVLQSALTAIGQQGVAGASANAIATSMATAIDAYFRTGLATNSVTGATISWV